MDHRGGFRLWLLLPGLFALAWFLPTLQHGFRSDDFLSVYYLDRDAATVRWGCVFEEWVRPWFGVRDLYRPLVSLSFGVNWALSTTPFGFHLLNVLLLAGTATFVAAAAAHLAPDRRWLAGLVAGALVVLHPAAVEPTAWIAARTTGLQVFWSAVAYWGFLRWRDGQGRPWVPLLATLLACASKEGAVLLPLSFVVLDLLRGSWPRARVHWPFFVVVGGYLVFRRLLLGWFTTAEEGHSLYERLDGAWALLGQLVAPPVGGGYQVGGIWFAALFVLVGLAMLAAGARRAMWCVPWALLLLLPGITHVQLAEGELAGRFVFDAVPALALFVAAGVARLPESRVARVLVVAAVAAIFASFTLASWTSRARYGDEARLVAKVQQELLAKAAAAEPGRPFGVVGLPKLPLLQPALWGFLTQRPFAERDLSVVGLENMLTPDPSAPIVFANSTAVHALVENGSGCAWWNAAAGTLVLVAKPGEQVVEFVQDAADPRRFVPPRLLPPTAVAALEMVTPVPVADWKLQILGNLEGPHAKKPFVTVQGEGGTTWWLDVTSVLPWFVAATFGGGPAGVELTCDGKPPPAGTIVRAHARLPKLGQPGSVPPIVDRSELARWIERPEPRGWYTLYLLLPTGLFAVDVPQRLPTELDPATRAQIDFACDVLGSCRIHWFWIDVIDSPGAAARRSGFGTCLIR